MLHSPKEFANRRARLLSAMPADSIAILAAANECVRNGDSEYPFRQNSDFYYLTGFNEPEAVAVFIPKRIEGEFILFNRARDPAKEVWTGTRAGQEGACSIYGAQQSFALTTIHQQLPLLMENKQRLYYAIGQDTDFDHGIQSWLATVRQKTHQGIQPPNELFNLEKILHEMRLHKSPLEIEWMRKAAHISVQAHNQAMAACKPGMREYDLEAEIQYVFTKNASRAPAYHHIIGSGANSCVLHYNSNDAIIKDGDLVLIDAGAEYANYAADITRTFPANGRFSSAQRAVYTAVLNTQLAVIAQIKPGVAWNTLQEISEQTITRELIRLGLLQGDINELLANRAYKKLYMHRIGHWLGMDVHDAGDYRTKDGQWRALAPGMVLTVEPGIYIPADSEGIDANWWNIGIRIEDDVLVTDTSHEVLSAGAPKTIEAIEAFMASARIKQTSHAP